MPFATLSSKPDAPLAYELFESNETHNAPLVVFINGLGLPAASWNATVSLIQSSKLSPNPSMLIYDRYGQGATTSRDPTDALPGKEAGYGHDFNDAVKDLEELLQVVAPRNYSHLILVAASIGVHLARLYTQSNPQKVAGLLILDSNIGNVEFTDLWPDPRVPDFKQDNVLSDDCSLEQYTEAYTKLGKIFNSDVKGPEGLDRRNVKKLLPDPASPKLVGPGGQGPWLIVTGHDPEHFADESLKMMKIPKSLTVKYSQP